MDIYMKTIGAALIALILCLTLSRTGKHYSMLLGILACCMVLAVAMAYLEPVVSFLDRLKDLISLDFALLEILMKTVGIGIVGEVAAMICTDSGNGALGKTLQLLTTILILWLSLPLLQTLIDLIGQILEAV